MQTNNIDIINNLNEIEEGEIIEDDFMNNKDFISIDEPVNKKIKLISSYINNSISNNQEILNSNNIFNKHINNLNNINNMDIINEEKKDNNIKVKEEINENNNINKKEENIINNEKQKDNNIKVKEEINEDNNINKKEENIINNEEQKDNNIKEKINKDNNIEKKEKNIINKEKQKNNIKVQEEINEEDENMNAEKIFKLIKENKIIFGNDKYNKKINEKINEKEKKEKIINNENNEKNEKKEIMGNYIKMLCNYTIKNNDNLIIKIMELYDICDAIQYYNITKKNLSIDNFKNIINVIITEIYRSDKQTTKYDFYWKLLYIFISRLKYLYKNYMDINENTLNIGFMIKSICEHESDISKFNHYIYKFLDKTKYINGWARSSREILYKWIQQI